jgi:hypothetical protein
MGDDDERHQADQRHRLGVLELVAELLEQVRVDHRGAGRSHEQRVAVRLGARHRLAGDAAAEPGLVLHDDWDRDFLGGFLRHHPRDRVDAATRCKADQHANRLVREVLPVLGRRGAGERRGGCGEQRQPAECHSSLLYRKTILICFLVSVYLANGGVVNG